MTDSSGPLSVAPAAGELREAADAAGLTYVSDDEPGYTRRKSGKGFTYLSPEGRRMSDRAALRRLKALVIPPAWTDVWIGSDPDGHLLATGRDAKGRKQYIYHPRFRAVREEAKYERLVEFAGLLPRIRETVARHMALRGLPREKVIATIVHLLETTLIRVGNQDYARQNESYGLTTLRAPHVKVDGTELRFEFKGKSGRVWRLRLRDRRIAKVIRACQELPGQQLFQYIDDDGEKRGVSSTDVNAYLREIAGCEVTAKDFRTWAGTVLAALALGGQGRRRAPPTASGGSALPSMRSPQGSATRRRSAASATCTRKSWRAISPAAWRGRSNAPKPRRRRRRVCLPRRPPSCPT